MNNIIDYIVCVQDTFSETPVNPVDSLIFSSLSYLNFEESGLVELCSSKRVLLHDIMSLSKRESLLSNSWLEGSKETTAFYNAILASRRMRNVEIAFFVHEKSKAIEKQFGAVTFFSADDLTYLAFRGTDGSFAGWKEDFNLSFKSVIPSQLSALRYLSGVASSCSTDLIIGGHSKGGNLAEYAALTTDESAFHRIVKVFNHDGPSFLGDPSPRMDTPEFIAIAEKTVPSSSIVGLLLEKRRNYRVVQSSAIPIVSHSPFSWAVEGRDFVYQDSLATPIAAFDEAFNDWFETTTPEQRERFADTIYDIFVATDASNWTEFRAELLSNVRQITAEGNRLDPETKKFLIQTVTKATSSLVGKTTCALLPSPEDFQIMRFRNR